MEAYTMAKMISDSALWFTQFITWAGELGAMVVGSPSCWPASLSALVMPVSRCSSLSRIAKAGGGASPCPFFF